MKKIFVLFAVTFLSVVLSTNIVKAQTVYLAGVLFNPDNLSIKYPIRSLDILCNTTLLTTLDSDTNAFWQYNAPSCNGNYYIRFTGSSLQTFRWSGDRGGSYNVRDFGAGGEGVTDDKIAIRDAIYFIASLNGGKLLFPRGYYKTSVGFTLPSGITIEGTNGYDFSNCRLELTQPNTHLFKIGEKTHGVSFKNILLTTNNTTTSPFYLPGSKALLAEGSTPNSSIGLVFRDMTIVGFEKGIDVNGLDGEKAWQLETVRLDHVQLVQNKTSIELDTYNTDWQISNSLIGAVKDGIGIDIKTAGAILIENSFGFGAGPANEIGTANVSETFIHIGGPHSVIKINNSQCEKFRNAIVVDQRNLNGQPYDDYDNPIMVTSSVFGDKIIFKTNVIFVSSGNSYLSDNIQTWVANQPLKFIDGTPYTQYISRNTSCEGLNCCNIGAPVIVPTPTTGSANNVKIYSTGDSFSSFNRYYCFNPNYPSDFIVSGGSAVYGGRTNTIFEKNVGIEKNLGVGTSQPGNGLDQYQRVLEIEGKNGNLPWLILNRSGATAGNRRWGWVVSSNGNLYLQDIGVANRLQIDTNGNIIPPTDNTGQIGTDTNRWAKVRATVIENGDLILSDKETGEKYYLIKEDKDNIYFTDYRTGNEMMRLDKKGNLYLKGKVFEGSESPKSKLQTKKKNRIKKKRTFKKQ